MWLAVERASQDWGQILLGVGAILAALKGWGIAKALVAWTRRPRVLSTNGYSNGVYRLNAALEEEIGRLRVSQQAAEDRASRLAAENYDLRLKLIYLPEMEAEIERLKTRGRSRSK